MKRNYVQKWLAAVLCGAVVMTGGSFGTVAYGEEFAEEEVLEKQDAEEPEEGLTGEVLPEEDLTEVVTENAEEEAALDQKTEEYDMDFGGFSAEEAENFAAENDLEQEGFFAGETGSEGTETSGSWTDGDIQAELKDGVLTITGKGKMKDYSSDTLTQVPWWSARSAIRKVEISSGVTHIGQFSFYQCEMEEAALPKGLKSIGEGAFLECSELKSIVIPDTVTTISKAAFADNMSLTKVVLGQKVQQIGEYAFQETAITSITLPASVNSVSNLTFYAANQLESIVADTENAAYSTENGVLFDKQKTKLILYPVAKRDSVYTVPGTVRSIEEGAFMNQRYLQEPILPKKLESIGDWAFYNAKELQKIKIPGSVTEMGYGICQNAKNLQTAVIENGVEQVSYQAFSGCVSLQKVVLGDSVKYLISQVFYNCTSLSDIKLPEGLLKIEQYTFGNCRSLTELNLPDSLIFIGETAFDGCEDLHVVYPSALEVNEDGDYTVPTKLYSITVSGTRDYTKAFEVLKLTNEERAKKGLPALKMDKDMLDAAMLRAAENAVVFDHLRPNGKRYYSLSSKINGENIAVGSSTAGGTMNQWINSPGHYANIMTEGFQSIGVGCFTYRNMTYWVQLFGMGKADLVSESGQKKVKEKVEYDPQGYGDSMELIVLDSDGAYADEMTLQKEYTLIPFMRNPGWSYIGIYPELSEIRWEFDPDQVQIDREGHMTAKKPGTVTVTAGFSDGGLSVRKTFVFKSKTPVLKKVENTQTGVKLTWKASEGVNKYRVFRKKDGGTSSKWEKLGVTTKNAYTDKTAKSNVKYHYTVRALDASGKNYISDYNKKGLGIRCIAAPEIEKISAVEAGVRISWKKVEGIGAYKLYRKVQGGSWKQLTQTEGTSYTDRTAVSGKTCFYRIRGVEYYGGDYIGGYDKNGTGFKYIAAPASVSAKKTSSGIRISWKAADGVKKYRVYRKNADGKWKKIKDTTSLSFTDKNVEKGKTYQYTVRSLDPDSDSPAGYYNKTGWSCKF